MTSIQQWKDIVSALSDDSLLDETASCARDERERTSWLVAHLAEIERRNLALKRGFASLFKYARSLGLSDSMAWEREAAARLALQMPEVVEKLATGELTLASAGILWRTVREAEKPAPRAPKPEAAQASLLPIEAPKSTPQPKSATLELGEKRELMNQLLGRSKRESEVVVEGWRADRSGAPVPKPRPASQRRGHGREWTELALYLSEDELLKWDQMRTLLSHKLGSTDPHAVFQYLLSLGFEKHDPLAKQARAEKRKNSAARCRQPETPRQGVPPVRRPLPAALKRQVWIRDHGKCQYEDSKTGRRCDATAFLDFDHVVPLASGGSDEVSNIRLACASHNRRRPAWGAGS